VFIEPRPEDSDPAISAIYDEERAAAGYVANYAKSFSHRPELMEAWAGLNKTIKKNLDLRLYELATLAAATALRSSYCSLAHGEILATRFYEPGEVAAMATDHAAAPLSPADTALMDYAAKVAVHADTVTQADIDNLRQHGFDDATIFDIASAAAARAFFTKLLEAVGAHPDAEYSRLDPMFRAALTVGKPLAEG